MWDHRYFSDYLFDCLAFQKKCKAGATYADIKMEMWDNTRLHMRHKSQLRSPRPRKTPKSQIRMVARAKFYPVVSASSKSWASKAAMSRRALSRWYMAGFAATRRWCVFTRSVSPGTCSLRSAAIAVANLKLSLHRIAAAPSGILLYLPQEGRGIGLMNKLRAYELQDRGMDTVEANEELGFAADSRDYAFSAEALKLLGVRRVRLLSNNPDKVQQLEKAGIRVVERVPCRPRTSRASRSYLETKRTKMGHLLEHL